MKITQKIEKAYLKNFKAINVQNTHDLLSDFCLGLQKFQMDGLKI